MSRLALSNCLWRAVAATVFAAWGMLSPSHIETARAQSPSAEGSGNSEKAKLSAKAEADIRAARNAMAAKPAAEAPVSDLVDALARAGRKRDALAEADRFVKLGTATAALRAQRGFLRLELDDTRGAAEDFAAALAGDGLAPDQRRNAEAGLAEAQTAETQDQLDRAETALKQRNFNVDSKERSEALPRDQNSEAAMRTRIDALSRAGRKLELQAEIDRLISRGRAPGWVYAQRGFARRNADDFQGAVQDFDAALGRGDLEPRSAPNIRYARAEAAAMLAEREGNPHMAEASYQEFLQTDPKRADAWYKLGYLLLQHKRRPQGAEALSRGLALRPVGAAYLDAANAYIFTNSPLASRLYREGLDRWFAGDPSLAGRSQAELERVKNEVVEADASIRTTISLGGIGGRPKAAGGSNNSIGSETRVRFDGRYLPAVPGLEAVAHGFSGKDSNGVRETDAGIGLRYRPIPDLNLYVGGVFDRFFQPNAHSEFVLNWGLGLGADAYPYFAGWKPYWDFGTFGAWRIADGRVLEDARGNAGYLYEFRAPVRGAIGPTILAVAGYDNKATNPWAAGIGPSVLSYAWLGGDRYRSYDAILSLQFGYVFKVGNEERQRGWRGQIGLTF